MAVICHKYWSTKEFHWDAKEKLFSVEISTLAGPLRDRKPVFGQVYDDACDEGIVLVSHKTGREVVCAVEKVDTDSEGDVAGWNLVPINKKSGRPMKNWFRVLIIND